MSSSTMLYGIMDLKIFLENFCKNTDLHLCKKKP